LVAPQRDKESETMRIRFALLSLLGSLTVAAPTPASASCTLLYNLQNGQTADAGQVMGNFNALIGCMGGTIQRSYLAGLTLSNDGTSPNTVLDVAAGMAADSTNATYVTLSSTLVKATQGAWAAGSGSNGMGNGLTVAASTWYHVFAIVNGSSPDVYFDTSPAAANAPSGTTAFRRVGSFKTDSSSHIIAFTQNGDDFLWRTPVNDVNVSNLSTSATNFTLSVPTGVQVIAHTRGYAVSPNAQSNMLCSSPDETGSTTSNSPIGNLNLAFSVTNIGIGYQRDIRTNTSAQEQCVSSASSTTYVEDTNGWIDRRGRDL
jgi:hypothetical protein